MKVKDLGRVVPLFRGVYNPEIEDGYEVLDMVYANGATWVALIDNPTDTPSDASKQWQIVCRAMINDEQIQEIEAAVLEIIAQQGYVMDPDYVHTSNDFTDELKAKVEAYEPPTPVGGNPFCVTVEDGPMALYLIPGQSYSVDNVNWVDVNSQAVVSLETGDTLYLHCTKTMPAGSGFKMLGGGEPEFTVSGDPRSLHYVDYTNVNNLRKGEFQNLFYQCVGLDIDENFVLPATGLAEGCYQDMFNYCRSLTSAPLLPATKMERYCYANMFRDCNSLVTPPTLPATQLEGYCYYDMFYGCSALTSVPNLPATQLYECCYWGMFKYCTSLVNVPANLLPAKSLQWSCYRKMFMWCSSLTVAPILPVVAPYSEAYSEMFAGCNSLTYVKCLLASLDSGVCDGFFPDTDTVGTLVKNSINNQWESSENPRVPQNWTIESEVLPVGTNWFTVTASEDSVYFTARFEYNNGGGGEYSTDGGQNWTHMDEYNGYNFSLNAGDSIMFHATGNGWAHFNIWDVGGDGHLAFSGDLRSVANEDYLNFDTYDNDRHASIFYGIQQLYDISQLTLGYTKVTGNASFSQMFRECRNLQNTPIWTITLAEGTNQEVFDSMFNECQNLQSVADLHNMVVGEVNNINVFQNMYYGCSGLTSISNAFPTPASYKNVSFAGMFRNCYNIQRVEDGMFNTPEALEILSLESIFDQCYRLEYIKLYEWLPKHLNWLQDAGNWASSPTIYLPAGAQPYESYQDRSGSGIPENWSIQYYD